MSIIKGELSIYFLSKKRMCRMKGLKLIPTERTQVIALNVLDQVRWNWSESGCLADVMMEVRLN
jgi:hypothetical protein